MKEVKHMKKYLFLLLAGLTVLSACRKELPSPAAEEGGYAFSSLNFSFAIERSDATKGVRSAWQSGDKVFIFFGGVSSAYVTVTYGDSGWGTPSLTGSASLEQSGTLTAVWLPYIGPSDTPSYSDGSWTFSGTHDYYFLMAEQVAYFITDTSSAATLGAYLPMAPPSGYVQLYVPDSDATSGTVSLACNALSPGGLAGIALDGSVTEASGTQGVALTGHADTIDSETGWYASGKLADSPGLDYYFVLDTGSGYKHYYKHRSAAMAARGAYQLPSLSSWPGVTADVMVAGYTWATANVGAAHPWALGTAYAAASMMAPVDFDTQAVPSDAAWTALLGANWISTSVLDQAGSLVVDASDATHYIFLPRAGADVATDYWSFSGNYLRIGTDGTPSLLTADAPASACLRLVQKSAENGNGGFTEPESGGEI